MGQPQSSRVAAEQPAAAAFSAEKNGRWSSSQTAKNSSGKSPKKSSGKSSKNSSGKLVANPEVEASKKSSGKNNLPLPQNIAPIAADDAEMDISFDDDISDKESGWRLEKNSNGYYRWRWQLKNPDGSPLTYVNKSGKIAYKRGSKYVKKNE